MAVEGQRGCVQAHVTDEARISASIKGVIGALFFLGLFGAMNVVAMAGPGGNGFDFLPQNAAVAFMACLKPALLTRRAAGCVRHLAGAVRIPFCKGLIHGPYSRPPYRHRP